MGNTVFYSIETLHTEYTTLLNKYNALLAQQHYEEGCSSAFAESNGIYQRLNYIVQDLRKRIPDEINRINYVLIPENYRALDQEAISRGFAGRTRQYEDILTNQRNTLISWQNIPDVQPIVMNCSYCSQTTSVQITSQVISS